MRRKKQLSDDDVELFRSAVGPVTPLQNDRIRPERGRPEPVPRKTLEDERQVLKDMLSDDPNDCDLETGEELWFARAGTQQRLMRRLRRGQFSVGAELDLHGMTVADARDALAEFLKECRRSRARCVRIVHGKGLGSRHGRPVIKAKLDRWLRMRDEVVAFSSARPIDGGTGAVYVLLKR